MIENISTYISQNYIGIVAALIGLLYLYLEYKANIWMWLASVLMAVFFIYIFFITRLYASMTIYIYFLGASIYGWWAWHNKGRHEETGEHIIERLPKKHVPLILLSILAAFLFFAIFLYLATENNIYIQLGDALTTALNVVALWMVSRKWAEQWCLVIPANLLSGILLMVQGETSSSIMFHIYFVVSIFGYLNWRNMANEQTK